MVLLPGSLIEMVAAIERVVDAVRLFVLQTL